MPDWSPNVGLVYNRLLQLGWNPNAAAGLTSRFMHESGPKLDPSSSGDPSVPGGSHNIGQWNRERWSGPTGLQNWAKEKGLDPNNPITGADFTDWELRNREPYAAKLLQNASTPAEGAAGAMAYERPQGWKPGSPETGSGWSGTLADANKLASNTPSGDGTPFLGSGGGGGGNQGLLAKVFPGLQTPSSTSSPDATRTGFAGLLTGDLNKDITGGASELMKGVQGGSAPAANAPAPASLINPTGLQTAQMQQQQQRQLAMQMAARYGLLGGGLNNFQMGGAPGIG